MSRLIDVDQTSPQFRLLVLCAIRVERESIDWSLLARLAQLDRGLDRLYQGKVLESSEEAKAAKQLLKAGLKDLAAAEDRVAQELAAAAAVDARLTTVFDADYPANLRLIPNLPPFLFYRGTLTDDDARSVAVVGTRKPSDAGTRRAAAMAAALAERGVTVTSGLAAGIDTTAHTTALRRGGRTIAVMGTGITKCYPRENEALAEEITTQGALVSQFWPTSGSAKWTFPRRNVVTSGISQGTVVIEASSTSGAKMQARLALEHGKRVFLVRSLVTEQAWAQKYLARGAIEVSEVEDVLRYLASPERVLRAGQQRQALQLSML